MLALIPLGGSTVNLDEFCNTATGNASEGIEVKNNLKSGFVVSFCSANSKTSVSNCPIQDSSKWQFCNMTQFPSAIPVVISFVAFGP